MLFGRGGGGNGRHWEIGFGGESDAEGLEGRRQGWVRKTLRGIGEEIKRCVGDGGDDNGLGRGGIEDYGILVARKE